MPKKMRTTRNLLLMATLLGSALLPGLRIKK
ncbi:ABC transporter substrate-binding protein [Escherichia coli]|uniref:ABC transporter substrate-binding protein n=1 Tax=Escherichia coli TaxID=562 RepID=A0A376NTC7_ECOLX|nr:ABC transporter substrate-binding protein [Escherichia coli]